MNEHRIISWKYLPNWDFQAFVARRSFRLRKPPVNVSVEKSFTKEMWPDRDVCCTSQFSRRKSKHRVNKFPKTTAKQATAE
jgi:hypothetical protein